MKRLLLAALLLAAGALHASAQRISLEVPLSPTPGLTSAASISAQSRNFPLALSQFNPSLSAASIHPVLNAVPLPVTLIPHALAAAKPVVHQTPKAIDSLREHGAASEKISSLSGENGKNALESNFMSAASLGEGPLTPPAGGDANVSPASDSRPLLARMLERVRLDDRGRADEKKALEDSFKRLLETPTGRRYAEEFLAEGLTAVVRFDDFPDSKLFMVENRKKFYAAQAYTDWRQEGYAEVRLNRHYVDGDPDFMRESLPSIIGHELLGHGLWYGRAAKENLYLAFHYHELNETLARLVGWAVDHELDGRFEEAGAWNYLSDPGNYLANLKMRLPYYAVTFGPGEMADPMGTLRARLASARQELERSKLNLASQKTWLPVLDHFSRDHGIPVRRFDQLRTELADLESHYTSEVANAEAIVSEVAGLMERMNAEPGRDSESYLRQAAAHPFFARLSADTARLGAALTAMTTHAPAVPPRPAAPRPADQITWEELSRMYRDDVAADATRAVKHWR